jgi:NitT/TauT family transport system substrate-binding protein
MNVSKRDFLKYCAAGAAAGLMGAPRVLRADMPNLKLGMGTWVGYLPAYVGLAKDFYKAEGLDLQLITFQGNDAAAAFAAGQVDMTSTAGSSTLVLSAQNVDFKNFMVTDFSTGADGILARNSIKSIADFKGKQIAVEEFAVSHFLLLQVLDTVGLKESDVQLVNLAPDAAAAAYQSGRVDIAVTYAPYLGQVNAQTKDGRIIFDTSKMPTAIVDFYLIRSDSMKNKPGAAEAFIKGTFKGLDYMLANPDEAAKIGAKAMEVDAAEVPEDLKGVRIPSLKESIAALTDPASPLYVIPQMKSLAQFLKDKGQISNVPDVERFMDSTAQNHVAAG